MPGYDVDMITPVLLCGGAGTRLWPSSRESYPKQFVKLIGNETLFKGALHRMQGSFFSPPLIVSDERYRFIVSEQLSEAGVEPAAIFLEPARRDTGPAILVAALHLAQQDPDTLLLLSPTDHMLPDVAAFHDTVSVGIEAAKSGQIVTFGVRPTRPETGFGYLELDASCLNPDTGHVPHVVNRFVEKPAPDQAEIMATSGVHLWNAGLFMATAGTLCAAFERHAPDLVPHVRQAVQSSTPDLQFTRLDPASWEQAPGISIDYAVMEHADNIVTVPFESMWSDLGSWNAVWQDSPQDDNGVVLSDRATALNCENTLLRSEDENLEIVGIGLKDIVAVATSDAVLVTHADHSQSVREALSTLKERGAPQARDFRTDHRPWGGFECLAKGPRFQVKRIVVHPGAALSLQSHHHRAEHWIVVQGTAEVTIGDKMQLVSENQSVYVPLGTVHRLKNPGKLPMVLIEVQTGAYLGEDDIVRYEDVYDRS